ncbi:MAG: RNA 3'-terminal phosphate cyclase [Nanoarchaeota archaeon]
MIIIDGSAGEGGGQVLRTALALSALSGKSFRIENIRAKRPSPGLQAQHLCAVRVVAQLCNAEIEGATIGSTTLTFSPGRIEGGKFEHDVGTAGSLTLVLQAALLPACFATKPVTLRLVGGTDVPWSPPLDYLRYVLLPLLRRFCTDITVLAVRRGYYPAGGGMIEIKVTPSLSRVNEGMWERFAPIIAAKVPRLDLTSRGSLVRIEGVAHASTIMAGAAERMADAARLHLSSLRVPIEIRTEYAATASIGGGITLWATFAADTTEITADALKVGASALLAKGETPEDACARAAKELIQVLTAKGVIDVHLADQMVPWLALAGAGMLRAPMMTSHATTNVQVVGQFLGKRLVVENDTIRRA